MLADYKHTSMNPNTSELYKMIRTLFFKKGGCRSAGYDGALNTLIPVFSLFLCPVFMVLGFFVLVVSKFKAIV